MSNIRWAAVIALILPACAGATGSMNTAAARPAGRAAQPGSWESAHAQANYVEHAGPRGQAEQPYAWLDSQPVYPRDQHRLAQDGMTYAGGRAGQPGSWKPSETNSWAVQLADNGSGKAKQ